MYSTGTRQKSVQDGRTYHRVRSSSARRTDRGCWGKRPPVESARATDARTTDQRVLCTHVQRRVDLPVDLREVSGRSRATRRLTSRTLRAGCHSPWSTCARTIPGPSATRIASIASNTVPMTWGLAATPVSYSPAPREGEDVLSNTLGQVRFIRWSSASSFPRPAVPRARCLTIEPAV